MRFITCFLFWISGSLFTLSGQQLDKLKISSKFLNASDCLSEIHNLTSCGLNYMSGSVLLTKRMGSSYPGIDQLAIISISGIPSSAKILKAFMWLSSRERKLWIQL